MSKSKKDKLSVFLSLILRHKPEAANISLDPSGWAEVSALIDGINKTGRKIDNVILEQIVEEDKKGRYSFSEDKTKIRANQGHSIDCVNVEMKEVEPPEILYHGTSEKNLESIMKNGIKSMSRQYVHLSDNIETAKKVGERHGEPIVLVVEAKKAYENGEKIMVSENGVWQMKEVDPKYIVERFEMDKESNKGNCTVHCNDPTGTIERLKAVLENKGN